MKELEDGCSCRMETPKLLDRLVVVITGTIPAPNTESESGPPYRKSPAGSYPSPWDNTGSANLGQEGCIA